MTVHTSSEAEIVAAALAAAAARHFGGDPSAGPPAGKTAIEALARESGGASRQTWSFDALVQGAPRETIATTEYGGTIPALVVAGNRAGTQFHVEKSQDVGIRLLSNFLRWAP